MTIVKPYCNRRCHSYRASMDVRNFLLAPLVKPICCSCSSLRLHSYQAYNTTHKCTSSTKGYATSCHTY